MPAIQCEKACPEFLSPATECTCITLAEYSELFPTWATKEDITNSLY